MDKEYYNKLNDLLKQTRYNTEKQKAEDAYTELCSRFSPAYLSGSSWYVGPTLESKKVFDESVYTFFLYHHLFK
jgi:hypothetical protein